jgi:hypothetical protein
MLSVFLRNFKRVEFMTKLVEDLNEKKMDAWWNCRNFVLNEDLCLDYDIGGLAVSATFLITVAVFCILASQVRSFIYHITLTSWGHF